MTIRYRAQKEDTMQSYIHRFLRFPFLLLLMIGAALAVASAAQAADKAAGGTLQGRVLFEAGKAPKVLTDTVVYLVGDGLASKGAASNDDGAAAILDQRDITFVPHVLPVMVGSKVEIRNSDKIMHNLHTRSAKNPSFNKAQLAKKSVQVAFAAPEIVPIGCDVHSQMIAYIPVLPTPFFTKAGKDGTYTIAGIPPGQYELVGWHEKYGTVSTKVEIAASKTAQVDVNFSKASAKPKEEK